MAHELVKMVMLDWPMDLNTCKLAAWESVKSTSSLLPCEVGAEDPGTSGAAAMYLMST